jgi:hypothetical protein
LATTSLPFTVPILRRHLSLRLHSGLSIPQRGNYQSAVSRKNTTLITISQTLPSRKGVSGSDAHGEYQLIESRASSAVSNSVPPAPVIARVKAPSLRSLLTPPLIIILINYAIFSLLEVALFAVLPIFLAAPLSLGGLGFTPATIGMCLAMLGLWNGSVQVLYFAKIHAHWGSKKVLRTGMLAYTAIFMLFPVVNWMARRGGVGFGVWMTLITQMVLFPAAMMISSAYPPSLLSCIEC